jgi:hypothetical protein
MVMSLCTARRVKLGPLGNLKPRVSCDTAVILSLPEQWWRAGRRMLPYQFRIRFEASVLTQNYC